MRARVGAEHPWRAGVCPAQAVVRLSPVPGLPDRQAIVFYQLAAQSCQRGVIQRVTKDTRIGFPRPIWLQVKQPLTNEKA